MAVKDEFAYHPTELLIAKQPRRHFRTSVNPIHWQLRSLIGVSKQDAVFYPAGARNVHIRKLNTVTNEAGTMRVLNFSPRCLVVKNGWLCCGGETGEFAAIQLDAPDEAAATESDPQGRLPPDLDLSQDTGALLPTPRDRHDKSIVVKSYTFGKERVNCITLWFPQADESHSLEGTYSLPVAVLANNDKHVTVVDLAKKEALDEVTYPDCVNRAVLSPDGHLLVAVSDDPYLYVHERVEKEPDSASGPPQAPLRPGDKPEYTWKLRARVHLKSQRKEDRSDHRGSFAACFSNTGKYLAVGTQYGMISIFDTRAFIESRGDPLVTCFASSKPGTEAGAVREMSFCPGPFDLLAWSEDRGAIGVADARNNFVSRQILQLTEEDAYEHIVVAERNIKRAPPQAPRIRIRAIGEQANSLAELYGLPGPGVDYQVWAHPDPEENAVDRYQQPLTADEMQVLEALQETRRRRDQRNDQQQSDRQVQQREQQEQRQQREREQREQREQRGNAAQNHALPQRTPWGARAGGLAVQPPENSRQSEGSRPRERSASLNRAVHDILGSLQTQRAHVRGLRETLEVLQRGQPGQSTGRTFDQDLDDDDDINPGTRGALRDGGILSRLLANPAPTPPIANTTTAPDPPTVTSRASSSGGLGIPGGWDNLEALYNISFETVRPQDRMRAVREVEAARREGARLAGTLLGRGSQDWDGDIPQIRMRSFGLREPPKPDETAGLAWNEDGTILYVGAEDGIYEFHVNVVARKFYPSVTIR